MFDLCFSKGCAKIKKNNYLLHKFLKLYNYFLYPC